MTTLFCEACSTPDKPVEAEPATNVCFHCGNKILASLHWIEECLPILDASKGSPSRDRRTSGFGPCSPIRDDVVVARDPRSKWDGESSPLAMLGAWGRLVALSRRMTQPSRITVKGEVAFLRANHAWIVQQAWVGVYAEELTAAAHAVRRLAGLSNEGPVGQCMVVRPDGDCGGRVFHTKDRSAVRCDRCGREYEGLAMVRLELAQRAS